MTSSIDKEILSGGELTSIFEIMQRYRNDGSCEFIIKEALEMLADSQYAPTDAEEMKHYNQMERQMLADKGKVSWEDD